MTHDDLLAEARRFLDAQEPARHECEIIRDLIAALEAARRLADVAKATLTAADPWMAHAQLSAALAAFREADKPAPCCPGHASGELTALSECDPPAPVSRTGSAQEVPVEREVAERRTAFSANVGGSPQVRSVADLESDRADETPVVEAGGEGATPAASVTIIDENQLWLHKEIERLRRELAEAKRQLGEARTVVPVDVLQAVERERNTLRDTLLAKHGGEPLALLAELDEARRERDEAVALLRRWQAGDNYFAQDVETFLLGRERVGMGGVLRREDSPMTPDEIRALAEEALPCLQECRTHSDWPIEAHYQSCPAYFRAAVEAAITKAIEAERAAVREHAAIVTYALVRVIRGAGGESNPPTVRVAKQALAFFEGMLLAE